MTTLRKVLPFTLLALVVFWTSTRQAQAQNNPDCSFTYTFTGDGTKSGVSNLSGNTPCVNWRVTLSTTGSLSSTVTFQTSPDNSTFTAVPNTVCSSTVQPPCILQGVNPIVGAQGMAYMAAYGNYVTVAITGSSGSGTGTVRAYGAKGASASAGSVGGGGSGGLPDPGSNGVVVRTALNTTVARTITASTGISVSNGDGVSGNPTISATGGGALSAITAATGANTIANGDNPQVWNWAETTAGETAMTFGETTASTSTGVPYLGKFVTLIGSTATPLNVTNSLNGSQTLPALSITPTWNTTGVVDAALFINATNTASGAASKLIDAQVSTAPVFTVDKTGLTSSVGGVATGAVPPACVGGTSGALCQGEGTPPTSAAAVGQLYTDSTLHDMAIQTNGGAAKLIHSTAPGFIHVTAKTAAITTATLCDTTAGACNQAGQYSVDWNFVNNGTACTVPGPGGVTFLLTWTDNSGAHSAVSLPMNDSISLIATSGTFTFQTTKTNAWASGHFNIQSTGAIIQYATGYTACTTGTGTYELNATVTRLQ